MTVSLGLTDASNKAINAIVSKKSEIIATTWQPTLFDGRSQVDFENESILLKIKGRNLGWKGHSLSVIVNAWRETGREALVWDSMTLEPLAPFEFEAIIPNPGGASVPLDATLDWEGGRKHIPIWPPAPEDPEWYARAPFLSTAGALLAVIVLWVGIPLLRRLISQLQEK